MLVFCLGEAVHHSAGSPDNTVVHNAGGNHTADELRADLGTWRCIALSACSRTWSAYCGPILQ